MSLVFRLPNGERVTVGLWEIEHFITLELSNQFDWRYNPKYHKVCLRYLQNYDKEKDVNVLQKVTEYILFYAENLSFSVYLWIKATQGIQRAIAYANEIGRVLEKLRRMHNKAQTLSDPAKIRKIIEQMISECIGVGIDPF